MLHHAARSTTGAIELEPHADERGGSLRGNEAARRSDLQQERPEGPTLLLDGERSRGDQRPEQRDREVEATERGAHDAEKRVKLTCHQPLRQRGA
jgi:hypothetical protein